MDGLSDGAISDFWVALAIQEIFETYGHRVKVGRKSLRKYGRDTDLDDTAGAFVHVSALGFTENYLSSNLITHAVSSSGSDTGSLYIEGMVLSGGNFRFVTQTITLTGQTKAPLTTALARVTRVRYLAAATNAGNIYVMEDEAVSSGVPTDLNDAHLLCPIGAAASLKAATSIAANNYFILMYWRANIARQTSTVADFELLVRQLGGSFIAQDSGVAAQGAPHILDNPPYRIIPPNSDIAVACANGTANVTVNASFGGIFADIITNEEWRRLEST